MIQKFVKIVCVIALQCFFLYEMIVIQGSLQWGIILDSFRWYDWLAIFMSSFFVLGSIAFETDNTDEIDDDYIGGRIINFLLCGLLIWKTISLEQSLPWALNTILICILVVGLFSILNFLYFLVSLLVAFGVYCLWNYSNLEGFLLYFMIFGIIVVGLIIMISMNNAKIAKKRVKEIIDENDFMREELKEKYKNENKWWKIWN